MEQPLSFDAALQRLDCCYEQMLPLIGADDADPDQLAALVAETTALFAKVAGEMEKGTLSGERRIQLTRLADRLQLVITAVQMAKKQIYEALVELKTAKQAINSYRPPA
ncbi:MAG: hypothetical protein PVG90_02170, partial [Bacillota bacterium]